MAGTKGFSARRRRQLRIRNKISGSAARPRLAVFRSERHIYAQLIDDDAGTTLVSASTMEKDRRGQKNHATCDGAKLVGEMLAGRAKAKGIETVVFDRGGYQYHGRVKSLADAAREHGLKF